MVTMTGSTTETSAGLMRLAADGDEVAFAGLVDAHHADMSSVCFVVTGGDIELTEEAVQSAWPIAWRKLHTIRDPSAFDRGSSRSPSMKPDSWRVVAGGGACSRSWPPRDPSARTPGDPGSHVGDIDLRNALVRMNPEDRALIALRYVAGFDSTELARALHMSPSGTRARLARLLGHLRSELGDG